jgi:hypothetical protein
MGSDRQLLAIGQAFEQARGAFPLPKEGAGFIFS